MKRERKHLLRLFAAQAGRCCYCDLETYVPMLGTRADARRRFAIVPGLRGSAAVLRRKAATREHLQRAADGGPDGIHNLKMACLGCNTGRGLRTPDAWRTEVQRRLAVGQHWWQVYVIEARRYLLGVIAGEITGPLSVADAKWWIVSDALRVTWPVGNPGDAGLRSGRPESGRGEFNGEETEPSDGGAGGDVVASR